MASKGTSGGCGCLILIAVGIAILAQCGKPTDKADSLSDAATITTSDGTEQVREVPSGNAILYDPDDTVYITASALNGRSEPSTSGRVVAKLYRGESAKIVDRSGEWLKIATTAGAVWITSQYVASSPPPRPQPLYSAPKRSHSRRGTYTDGTCPCSGSRVCIGPRGGRYCITSGGNKRYGV